MSTINISLSDDVSGHVEERVATSEFQTSSDYVRELIHRDREQLQRFHDLIHEGLNSSMAGPADDAYFEGLRGRIRDRSAGC